MERDRNDTNQAEWRPSFGQIKTRGRLHVFSTFEWSALTPTVHSAMLENTPSSRGRSKLVFKAIYNGFKHVAKRCYAVGGGIPVTVAINHDELDYTGTHQLIHFRFRKYSGTLDHPRHNDKQGATINIFQHFSYFKSNKTLVLADIQGSEHYDPSKKATILFDLMSHTTTGDTGAGDHGEAGIKSFVDQHRCGQRCIQMELEPLNGVEEDEL
ncbi:kinase-like domain-containing protein [Mycena capillaripes]|nr:kinase-like domain-containing protein [Mycena capillaripes]